MENHDQMTVMSISNECDIRVMGEGVMGHWLHAATLEHSLGLAFDSKWDAVHETTSPKSLSGWVEPRLQFRCLKQRLWPVIKVGQHHVFGLDLTRPSYPRKTGRQSSHKLRSLGSWGEETFPAVLMGCTGSLIRDHVHKDRWMDVPSYGLSSFLGLWNPCWLSPQ